MFTQETERPLTRNERDKMRYAAIKKTDPERYADLKRRKREAVKKSYQIKKDLNKIKPMDTTANPTMETEQIEACEQNIRCVKLIAKMTKTTGNPQVAEALERICTILETMLSSLENHGKDN